MIVKLEMNKTKHFDQEKVPKLSLRPRILISIITLATVEIRSDYFEKEEWRNVHNVMSTTNFGLKLLNNQK